MILGWVLLAAAGSDPLRAAAPIDFSRDILPILSDKCFHCHGPDEQGRKAGLRLDTPEGAFRTTKGRVTIVPGRSAESPLIRRVFSSDPDELMPPPDSHRSLTLAQKDLLKRWVDEGARWSGHWAFRPFTRPEPPAVKNGRWAKGPLDRFILAALEREGLRPSKAADKERLLRRVTFDLTGLPPTVAECDAFLADRSPAAFAKVVDRLLTSPRFGERMATDWLDVARYADTHGYQMDRYRAVWPYRDWVIGAFNRNLPFDQFATWQLAGDLLPGATKEQRLATAFNRLHMQNEEGGIVEEEFRVAYVVDRVNTFGTAFLGLTLECSRCHDHKYDPVSMRDFYSLFSFFQNIDESGQTVYFGEVMPVPTMLLSTDEEDARLARLREAVDSREQAMAAARASEQTAFGRWLEDGRAGAKPAGGPGAGLGGLVAAFDFESVISNKLTSLTGTNGQGRVVDNHRLGPGRAGQAAVLDGENGFVFPGLGAFTRSDPFTLGLWLQAPPHEPRAVVMHKSRAWMDAGSRGYELVLEEGRVSVGLHHMWPGNSLKIRSRAVLPTNQWVHLAFSYDGSSRAAGLILAIDGVRAEVEVVRDGLWKDITYGGGEPDLTMGHRFRDSGFKGGRVDDLAVFDRALTPLELAQLAGKPDLMKALTAPVADLGAGRRQELFELYASTVSERVRAARARLHEARTEQRRFIEPIRELMTMEEMPAPKPAHVLKRGAYDSKGDRVSADTPASLPPFPADAPRNRLGLARWLFSPGHPLTARVTANRLWQQMFGKGLVETVDNFGSQGAQPTHPELLDWLASELMRMNWDVKQFLRMLALSATYQQSSEASAELLARDPGNRWLARAPARRLTAEMLRDQALAAGGLLVEKLGGPSVRPYQPAGLWEIAMGNPRYETGKGADLYRRSLYTFWKRTVPPPAMMTLDAADRSNCSVKRQSTSTPLQALALLNDTQLVEAARLVSRRMMREGGNTPEQRLAWGFRAVTGREPTRKERRILGALYREQQEYFRANPGAAEKYLAVGESRGEIPVPAADLAAGAVVAQALLNHDEALLRR